MVGCKMTQPHATHSSSVVTNCDDCSVFQLHLCHQQHIACSDVVHHCHRAVLLHLFSVCIHPVCSVARLTMSSLTAVQVQQQLEEEKKKVAAAQQSQADSDEVSQLRRDVEVQLSPLDMRHAIAL